MKKLGLLVILLLMVVGSTVSADNSPQLNVSHIECVNMQVVIHFVLVHTEETPKPGNVSFTDNGTEYSVGPDKFTGGTWHFSYTGSDGYHNITSASVEWNGTTYSLHNPGDYAGDYNCSPATQTETAIPTVTQTETAIPTVTQTETAIPTATQTETAIPTTTGTIFPSITPTITVTTNPSPTVTVTKKPTVTPPTVTVTKNPTPSITVKPPDKTPATVQAPVTGGYSPTWWIIIWSWLRELFLQIIHL